MVSEVSHILLVDMMGERVGKLTVVARAPNKNATARWECRCDCGNTVVTYGYVLRQAQHQGKVLSCNECRSPSAHRTSTKPRRKHGKLNICAECGNLPHRVKGRMGAKCRGGCGTVKQPDKLPVPPWRSVS